MNIDEQYKRILESEERALYLYKKTKLIRLRIELYRQQHPESKEIEIMDGVIRECRG